MLKNNKILYAVIGVCVIFAGVFYVTGRNADDTGAVYEDNVQTAEPTQYINAQTEPVTEALICVYVCGSVQSPDVYYISAGKRIADAIKAAGGATEEAYLQALNLAEVLSDGQRLYVPSYEEASEGADFQIQADMSASQSQGLVNINTADTDVLMSLPGIGQSKAQSIIAYREENGAYKAIEDIMNVSGIKEAAFSKIKDFICV